MAARSEHSAASNALSVNEARARELLFDYLVVAERGCRTSAATSARRAADGSGNAVVEGTAERLPATEAALANGIAAHAIELDDTYEHASLHPGVAIWPALLAVADERSLPLADLLIAASAGYDAMCALGNRLDPSETYARGFHPTGVCGPIGAAVAVAHLMRLTPEQTGQATGIAASMSSGLLEFIADGAWTKPLHAGHAASSGIRAARLAAVGYTGPATAIEGSHGFLHAFGRRAGVPPGLSAGESMARTAVKRYSCCRYMHGCIDLLLEIADEEDMQPGDVDAVRCGVLSAGWQLVADPPAAEQRIRGQVDAQFSMAFGAALALTRRTAGLDDFERAGELARELEPLMRRVECFRSPRLDAAYPAAWGAEVEVRTRGGRVLTRAEDHFLGSPERPFTRDDLLAKASGLVGEPRAHALLQACIETPPDAPVEALARGTWTYIPPR